MNFGHSTFLSQGRSDTAKAFGEKLQKSSNGFSDLEAQKYANEEIMKNK